MRPSIKPFVPQEQQPLDGNNQPIKPYKVPENDPSRLPSKLFESNRRTTGESTLNYDFPTFENQNRDEVRANRQSDVKAVANSFVQGAFQFAGDVVATPGWLYELKDINDTVGGTETEWGNALTKLGEEIANVGKEVAPVYSTEENQKGFHPGEGEWWANMIPSMFSTLSLALPALGEAKLLGAASKAVGQFSKVGKFLDNNLTKGVVGAITSRHIESMMEAKGTFETVYQNAIRMGKSDAEAKQIAGQSASSVYNMNYANLLTDIPQYMMMFGGIKFATRGLQRTTKEAVKEIGLNMAGEAFEEGAQFVMQKEGEHQGNQALGIKDASSFIDRLGVYAKDSELYNAAFFGALGGGVFGAVMPAVRKKFDKNQQEFHTNLDLHNKAVEGLLKGDIKSYEENSEKVFLQMMSKSAQFGELHKPKQMLEGMLEQSDEEIAKQLGVNKTFLYGQEVSPRELLQHRLEQVKRVEKTYDYVHNKYSSSSPEFKQALIAGEINLAITNDRLKGTEAQYNRQVAEEASNSVLSESGKSVLNLKRQIAALKTAKASLKHVGHIVNKEESAKEIDNKIARLEKELTPINETHKQEGTYKEDSAVIENLINSETTGIGASAELLRTISRSLSKDLVELKSHKGEKEFADKFTSEEAKIRRQSENDFFEKIKSVNTEAELKTVADQYIKGHPNQEKLIEQAKEDIVKRQKETAPAYDPNKPEESLKKRFEGRGLLEEAEMKALGFNSLKELLEDAQLKHEEHLEATKEERAMLEAERNMRLGKMRADVIRQAQINVFFDSIPTLEQISPVTLVKYRGKEGYVIKHESEDVLMFEDAKTGILYDIPKTENGYSDKAYEYDIYELTKESSILDTIDFEEVNGRLQITIEGKTYRNGFSNSMMAINRDENGDVTSVRLDTLDGKPRIFKKYAEELAYIIQLHTYNKLENEGAGTREETKSTLSEGVEGQNSTGEESNLTTEDKRKSEEVESAIAELEKGVAKAREQFNTVIEETTLEEEQQQAFADRLYNPDITVQGAIRETEEAEENPLLENLETALPLFALVPDKVLYQLIEENGVKYAHVYGKKFSHLYNVKKLPLDKAKELGWNINENLPLNKWTTMYDDNGNSIETEINDKGVDPRYINTGQLQTGDTLELVINEEESYTKTMLDQLKKGTLSETKVMEGLPVQFKINGVIVGELKAAWDSMKDQVGFAELLAVRKQVFEKYKNKTTAPITVKVKQVLPGRLSSSNTFRNPHEVADQQPLIFGIVKNGQLIINNIDTLEKQYGLNLHDLGVAPEKAQEGAAYMILKAPNGKMIPIKIFAKKVKEVESIRKQVKQLLKDTNAENWVEKRKAVQALVYIDYNFDKAKEKRGTFTLPNKTQYGVTAEELYDLLDIDNKIVQLNLAKINVGDYNKTVSEEGRFSTNLMQGSYIHSAKFEWTPVKESPVVISETPQEEVKIEQPEVTQDLNEETVIPIKEENENDDFLGDISLDNNDTEAILFSDILSPEHLGTWNEEEEKAWFKSKFPQVPIEVLNNLKEIHKNGGAYAYGMFYKGAVYLLDNAPKGTTYHEAFHVVFRLFSTPEQRQSIINEAKEKYKKPTDEDISNFKALYPTLSEKEITDIYYEEILANEFRLYVITQEETAPTLGNRIKTFFKKLFQFLKAAVTNKVSIEELFFRTQQGMYKKKVALPMSKQFSETAMFSTQSLTIREQKAAIDMINKNVVFRQIIPELQKKYPKMSLNQILTGKNKAKGQHNIELIYETAFDRLAKTYLRLKEEGATDPAKAQSAELLRRILKAFGNKSTGKMQFQPLYQICLRGLAPMGIKIQTKGNIYSVTATDSTTVTEEKPEFEQNTMEEQNGDDGWQTKSVHVSNLERLSQRIKSWLWTIEERNEDLTPKKNEFGFTAYMDGNFVYNKLQYELSDTFSSKEMMEKVKNLIPAKPYMKRIYDDMIADTSLRTEVYNSIAARNFTHYIMMTVSQTNEYKIFSSNRTDIVSVIVDNLKEEFRMPNAHYRALLEEELTDFHRKYITQGEPIDEIAIQQLTTIIKNSGLKVSAEDVVVILEENGRTRKQNLDYSLKTRGYTLRIILDAIHKGINPFDSNKEVHNSLRHFARKLSKNRENLYQLSFRSSDNKTTYAHNLANFLSRRIIELTGSNSESFISQYLETAFYKTSPLLNELKGSDKNKELFGFHALDGIKYAGDTEGKKYTALTETDITNFIIHSFYNGEEVSDTMAYYSMPIPSDAPVLPLVSWKKYSNEEIVENLYLVAQQEYNRIKDLEERLVDPTKLSDIKNFTNNGKKFLMLDFLNEHKQVFTKDKNFIKGEIRRWLDAQTEKELERFRTLGIIKEVDGKIVAGTLDKRINNPVRFLRNFVWNDILMQSQLITIFEGDPAFYKNKNKEGKPSITEDFFKRAKQTHSPRTFLDVDADFKGERINAKYLSLFVKDIEFASNKAKQIEETLKAAKVKDSLINEIMSFYKKDVNEADAQAYITIGRYREIMIGLARWSDPLEALYQDIKAGKDIDYAKVPLILQPIKPFYFNMESIDGMIVPMQNKNAETVLIPQLVRGSKELTTLLKKMEEAEEKTGMKVSVQFESAVKVGGHNIMDINDVLTNGIQTEKLITLDNAYYGLQQEVPVHHMDSTNLLGTQIRKNIINNLVLGNTFSSGRTGEEILRLYNDTLVKDLEAAYNETAKEFDSKEKIKAKLQEQIVERDLGDDYLEAVDRLPLWFPSIVKTMENICNSIFRNGVTKISAPGGIFVNFSGYGFSDELRIITDGGSVKYVECFLPAWSKEFFKEGQTVTVEELEKAGLDLGMVYRIPNEDKYSTYNVKVKKFLPETSGGIIMLPSEVTTISGLDFDVDKMFAMFYYFKRNEEGQLEKVAPSMDTKEGRHNLRLELMMEIWSDPTTTESIFNPGNFEIIRKIAGEVNEKEGKDKEILNPLFLSTRTEIFQRNMAGKALIGIFANHNANHAQTQFSNIRFTEAVKFDEEEKTSLSQTKDTKGNPISKSLATYLAMVVDNAKDPLASFVNMNLFTADVIAMITRLGYSPWTALRFTSQPIIKDLAYRYFLYGADFSAYRRALNEVKTEFGKEFEINGEVTNLNTNDLKESLGGSPYTEYQAKVLNNFIAYKEQADALADFVQASRSDTKGAGPTQSDNEVMIRKVANWALNTGEFSTKLLGADEFFDKKSKLNNVLAFFEEGIEKPNTLIESKLELPWNKPQFRAIKDAIIKMAGRDMDVRLIEKVNYQLLHFLSTGFHYYRHEQQKSIFHLLPELLVKYKKANPQSRYEKFLSFLEVTTDPTSNMRKIYLAGTTGLTKLAQQEIKSQWKSMLYEGTEEEKKLAKNLALYAFHQNGFTFGPMSFSHLIPASFMADLKDSNGTLFMDFLKSKIDLADAQTITSENEFYSYFLEQFIRNNVKSLNFIPKVIIANNYSDIEAITWSKESNPQPETITVKMTNKFVPFEDMRNIVPYIKYDIGDKTYLFKHIGKRKYARVNPLGINLMVLEYDMKSAFPVSHYAVNEGKEVIVQQEEALQYTPEVKEVKSLADFVNHSGGALRDAKDPHPNKRDSSDLVWEDIGDAEYGVKTKSYSFPKHNNGSKKEFKVDTTLPEFEETLNEAGTQYAKAAKELKRAVTNNSYIYNMMLRNWFQVKYSDKVFAIGRLDAKGKVQGGTGYAVQMAINNEKPVVVFDLNVNQWKNYNEATQDWEVTDTPVLTPNFAGIGTREITPEGILAIREVYKKTADKFGVVEKKKEDVTIVPTGEREYTPETITSLKENEIFVFGSNAEGRHGKGAALQALKFGAKYGVAEGQYGKTYAIITKKDWRTPKSSTLDEISKGIEKFLYDASINDTLKYYVTKLGSSLAGYSVDEIKEIFRELNERVGISDNVILPQEYEVRDNNQEAYKWARHSENNYEVSSAGDKRFSALHAKLKDGRTIEEAYQLDIKGYRVRGNDWKLGKGKAPIRPISKEQQWQEYKQLWRDYLNQNVNLLDELRIKAKGKVLTDTFATTEVSQARALAEILNEAESVSQEETTFAGETITDEYQYFGAKYTILLNEDGIGLDVLNLKQSASETNNAFALRKGKILAAYQANPNVDVQNGKYFRNEPKAEPIKVEAKATPGKKGIVFNKEQQEAINKAVEFIQNGDPKDFFVIQGKAGTGKTTIMKAILNEVINKTVVAGALSHKAKAVLRDSIGKKRGISYHSIAGMLAQTMDQETGQFVENKFAVQKPIEQADLIIIDEASMVNEDVIEKIFEQKRRNAKVIFLGDIGQLPPIRTVENSYYTGKTNLFGKKSPVFDTKNKAELVTRVRQGESSPILPFADHFWNNSQSANPVTQPATDRKTIIAEEGALIFANKLTDIAEDAVELFKQAVAEKKPNLVKFVSYKNVTRTQINTFIHNSVFGMNSPHFNEGELVIFNDGYGKIENATETQVEAVTNDSTDENGHRYYTLRVSVETEDGPGIEFVNVINPEDKGKHDTYVGSLFNKWKALKAQGDKYGAQAALAKAWEEKKRYANLDYGYAITAHKSQGSTYDVVIVHEQDIMSVSPTSAREKSEAIYTALTRPKNIAVVLSSVKVAENEPMNLKELNDKYVINRTKDEIKKLPDNC